MKHPFPLPSTRFRLASLALASTLLVTPGGAGAQSSGRESVTASEVDELRREVRSLRAQVEALRGALTDVAEADHARANALTRALGRASGAPSLDGAAAEPAAAAPPPSRKPAPAARPVAAAPAVHAKPAPEVASAGTLRGKIQVPNGEPVAYVYVENVPGPALRGQKVKIEQSGKQFVPSWAVVQRGTTVEFPNNDAIYHNVFSLSTGNSFDLGLYNSSGDPKAHTFLEPGAVDVFCNIHPQMAASVLVVPNRLFAKVRPDGTFDISDVPAGRRKVVAWAPGSKLSAQWVQVDAGSEAQVSLRLEPKSSAHRNKFGRQYGSYE